MPFYRYFRWLSLDIVLGAIIFLHFLADLYALAIEPSVYLALGIAIWLIYTTDHLIDASISTHPDARRNFHRVHQSKLIFISGALSFLGLINIYFLPLQVIRSGAVLCAFCVLYLLVVYFIPRFWFKEILVAVGYSSGIFLAPLALKGSFGITDFILVSQLSVLASINLLIFSLYDRERDSIEGFGSLVMKMNSNSGWVINFLLLALFSSALYFLIHLPAKFIAIQLVYMMMTLILFSITRFRLFFGRKERFRIVGDAVFYVPLIFLIL